MLEFIIAVLVSTGDDTSLIYRTPIPTDNMPVVTTTEVKPIQDAPVVEMVAQPATTETIKGLVAVDKAPGFLKKNYDYQTTKDNHIIFPQKLKRVPDLRPYEVQHPVWHKIQTGFNRWGAPIQGASSGASAGVGAYALYKIIHK